MEKREWRFVYDEEICDTLGSNFMGIITDGCRFLFFHALPEDDLGDVRCYIFSSLQSMFNHDDEELSYPWTAENDELLLKALNSLDEDSTRYCGEDSVYHEFFTANTEFAEE